MKTNSVCRLALVLGLTFAGAVSLTRCSEKEAKPEPTTTYNYDPLKDQAKTVTEEPKIDRKPAAIPKIGEGLKTYVVQIEAFTKKENAERMMKQLEAKNYPVFIKNLDHKDFGQMYLVRLRPTTDRNEADRYLAQIRESENLKPVLIIPPRRQ